MIGNPKRLKDNLGNKVGISNTTHISNRGENLKVGNNVFIGHFNYIDAHNAEMKIGNNVQITNYCNILTHSTHNDIRFPSNKMKSEKCQEIVKNMGSIFIDDFTYIGPHSVIMPGTKLGKGCIVAAYSYVKGEFPDFSILRGQPAKIVGSTKEIDEELIREFPELNSFHFDFKKC
ncbi:MAG: acyltransferase [Bacteroidetes bacterium]|nr:acyltransferase [Bacteroidota bacterium]